MMQPPIFWNEIISKTKLLLISENESKSCVPEVKPVLSNLTHIDSGGKQSLHGIHLRRSLRAMMKIYKINVHIISFQFG